MSIPQSFLQELLARVDVVEVVGRYVQLKKGGANFMGLCPFHGEKSPSFSVSPAKQFYHCFGCGVNGNAISFLMAHAGMSFVEAVKDLAQQTGLNVPDDDTPPQDKERQRAQREHQTSLTDLLDTVAKGYQKHLKTSPRAIAYLKGRGLSGEIAHAFGLGYTPEGWRTLAGMVPDYGDSRLVESGMVIAREEDGAVPDGSGTELATTSVASDQRQAKRYDRFRDRIMFPIRNVKGETIGFGGRVLDKGEPKYLNSPETPVFSKGRELYGLFEARTPIRTLGYALVTEGYMDVVALAQLGFANAVATLGTACTADHIQKLFRFTEAVVFSFDGDSAGRRAASKAMLAALPYAQDTRSIKFLFLPPEHDPDSYVRANGTDAFAQQVLDAMPLSQFLLETARTQCDMSTPEGRARMASNAKPLWMALPDGALKRQMLTELASQIGLGTHELTDLWKLTPAGNPSPQYVGHNEVRSGVLQHAEVDFEHDTHSGFSSRHIVQGKSYARQRGSQAGNRYGKTYASRETRFGPRPPPPQLNTRAELAARILFSHPKAWEWLTPEDQHLLAHLPEPMGPLLSWAEGQWHEYGIQTWAVLQQAMAGQPFESMANALMAQALSLNGAGDAASELDAEADTKRELREVLWRMLIDDLMTQETLALADASTQPEALQRYKTLYERRCALQKQIQAGKV